MTRNEPTTHLSASRRTRVFGLIVAMTAIFALQSLPSTAAQAAVKGGEQFATFGTTGEGAGQLLIPGAIATDPRTGHVYVADSQTTRIDDFTPWGEFVRAFGWDVAPGAVDGQQEVRVKGTEGDFRLSFEGSETPALAFGASAQLVQAELESLPTIGTANAQVTEVKGTTDGATPFVYVVSFRGTLGDTKLKTLAANSSSLEVVVRVRAAGGPSSTGLETCTTESGCRSGAEGEGAGELAQPGGLLVDSQGDVYVREITNNRVQKFDSSGEFLLMFGNEVDKTTGAGVCTEEDIAVKDDVCGAGAAGPSTSGFEAGSTIAGLDAASGTADEIFIPDGRRIQVYEPDGEYVRTIAVPGLSANIGGFALDTATSGFYVTEPGLHEEALETVTQLSPTGAVEGTCGTVRPPVVSKPFSVGDIAGGPDGDLYYVENNEVVAARLLSHSAGCSEQQVVGETLKSGEHFFSIYGLGTNAAGDVYATVVMPSVGAFITAYGPGPVVFESPQPSAPSIEGQFAASVTANGASAGAFINPHFWTDTRFYIEYGTGPCSSGGCQMVSPEPPGGLFSSRPVNSGVRGPLVSLTSLQPSTTYHYRVVAQSGGGGPVTGIGGKVGSDGAESTFTTPSAGTPPQTDCPNQALRTGLSALLPDCRAYEMVSPIEKTGGDIFSGVSPLGFFTDLTQSSTDGNKVTYSSYRSFGEPAGAPYTNQYLATRSEAAGWSSESISAPVGKNGLGGLPLEAQHKAFSADLCDSWLIDAAEPPLASGAGTAGFDPYRRSYCGGERYESLVHVEPPGIDQSFEETEIQGFSEDGTTAVFRGPYRLTEDSSPGDQQAYISEQGSSQRYVCVLPDGQPWAGNCSAGASPSREHRPQEYDRFGNVIHALSEDGRRLYWTAGVPESTEAEAGTVGGGAGKIFLRENPDEEQSAMSAGTCLEPEKACTIPVSETASTKAAHFLAASPDGSRAVFVIAEGPKEGSLYRFEPGSGSTLVAAKTIGGLAGQSSDLSTLYFVSEERINGSGVSGKPNLYVWQEGSTSFIGTLSVDDTTLGASIALPSDVNFAPIYHAAQASSDGSTLAFISDSDLTGYDNTDVSSRLRCGTTEGSTRGACDSEVYVYQVGSPGPVCVSCAPTGAQPEGREIEGLGGTIFRATAAGFIPAPHYQLSTPQLLSSDGKRLVFDSYDALVPRDVNEKEDVYEWEAATSAAQCTEDGAELYVPSATGCLSLITTGESTQDSEVLDADPEGNNVFFSTGQSLLPQDPAEIDIYDARVFGGIPPGAATPPPCEGESCQPRGQAPARPSTASETRGPGNPHARTGCPKGSHRVSGKSAKRCVRSGQKGKGHAKKHRKKKKGAKKHRKAGAAKHHRTRSRKEAQTKRRNAR